MANTCTPPLAATCAADKGLLRSKPATVRASNIELLRIIAMFLVLVVHADFWALGGPSAEDFAGAPLNAFTRTFIQSLSIVCVNVFILISGWFGIRASVKGLSNFVFQCAYFLFGIYAVMLLTGTAELSVKGIAGCLCLTSANWFIRAYVALYILSPILNAFVEKATKRQMAVFLTAFYLFQTIYGWSGAAKFVEMGYSCFSFIGLYLLARFARTYGSEIYKMGGGIYMLTVAANTVLYYLLTKIGIWVDVYAYVNPLVVLGALGLIMWFGQLDIRPNKFINWVAKSSFAVFLIHSNPNIGEQVFKPLMIDLYRNHNGLFGLLTTFFVLLAIYAAGVLLDQPRKWLWKAIGSKI